MYKNYRYKDPLFSSYGKTTSAPKQTTSPKQTPFSFSNIFTSKTLNSLDTDDYILMVLIFMLIKNSAKPDWPLIFALFYILLDGDDN